MDDRRTILVTGAAGLLGERVMRRLAIEDERRVVGLDRLAGVTDSFEIVLADLSAPELAEFLSLEGVQIVCHLGQSGATQSENIQGMRSLLAACVTAGVKKIVLRSSTAVYGARPDNSAFLGEMALLRGNSRFGDNAYLLEMEAFCRGFQLHFPALQQVVLRFANMVGPTVDSPLVRYLSRPVVPTIIGFNPLLQVIHEDDVVEALVQAVLAEVSGLFNVAAEGALPLKRIIGLAGRPMLPNWPWLSYKAGRRMGFPFNSDYVRYRWVADLSKMRQEWGFLPTKLANEAILAADYPRPEPTISRRASGATDGKELSERIARRKKEIYG